MFAAAQRLLPAAAKFARQIVPPVIATLIAAGLISAYNRAFSGHLQQPRMAALHHEPAETQAEVVTVDTPKPLAATGAVAIYDTIAPPRLWEKEGKLDAGKDQTVRVVEPVPAPAPVRTAVPRGEPKSEPRHVAAVEQPAPAARAPVPATATPPVVVAVPPSVASPPTSAPMVAAMPGVQDQRQPVYPQQYQQQPYQQPPQYAQPPYQQPPQYPPPVIAAQPPVIMAQPMVTVPDKPRPADPQQQAQAEPARPPQGVLGVIVDTLKPSNLFARAREFGDKIEAAGNDILPNVRQQ